MADQQIYDEFISVLESNIGIILKISTWIYRIALNTAMNFYRRSRKKPDFLQGALKKATDEPSSENDADPRIEILYDCISDLDEFSRAMILLYLDGYKHEEIAEITGITKTNVGTRISRIKEQLRINAKLKLETHGNG